MNPYLSTLFKYLREYEIKYFLLTDFECDFRSNDIDIYVDPADRLIFEAALYKHGWFKRKEPPFHVNHNFYLSPHCDYYLDVKYELTFANSPQDCYSFNRALNRELQTTLNNSGLFRPFGMDAILLYAAHLAYKERGKLEDKHRTYLQHYIDIYKEEIDSSFMSDLNLIENWLHTGFPSELNRLQNIISPYFDHSKKPMTRSNGVKYGYGLNVLFLGTDGSGKTTLVEAVGNSLKIKNNKLYLGAGESNWSSYTMKSIYNYRFGNRPFRKIHSLVKTYMVLPLELLIRIIPIVKKSRYNVTLIDRFPGFIYLNNNIIQSLLYKSILPQPDLVFFLHASPEVLVQRKPNETTIERSIKDLQRFEKVADAISRGTYKKIDTTNLSVNEARKIIIDEIFNHPKVHKNLLTTETEY